MAVPDFQTLMLPVLLEFADGAEHLPKEIRLKVAARLHLSPEEIEERVPSGTQSRLANRVAWAHIYLKRAELLTSPRRGVYRIAPRGEEVLKSPPSKLDMAFLERCPEYREFRVRNSSGVPEMEVSNTNRGSWAAIAILTPDEQVRAGYQLLRPDLAAQLLERVRQASPRFF